MPITRQTVQLGYDLRVTVDRHADQATRAIVQAWARAWDELAAEMAEAALELARLEPGSWPARRQVLRSRRARRALATARAALLELTRDARVTITDAAGRAVVASAEAQPRILASQLPPSLDAATLAASFDRVAPTTLRAIVARSRQQITALSRPLTSEATEALKRALVRGVPMGENPRTTARAMLARLESVFNGGASRALTVARTEILDAHRAAAQASHAANAEVLTGWVWVAQLDARTCPSCWAQHGSFHELSEPGPSDHQNGRCVRMPKTRSWFSLGFNVAEPPDLLPDARALFDRLPQRDRLAIMGPARLAGLDSGAIPWGGLSIRRRTDGWRDSFGTTPLRDLARL